MNSVCGQIPEFYGDDWNVYYERLEQFLAVNDIPENKQSALLISVLGPFSYKTLRDLCHPALPKEKTFAELCELLRRQFTPQVSCFRERSKFYSARQEPYESILQWYVKIKKLSVDCRFGANLENVLLDKFVTGLRSGPILDRLCEENETITLQQALDIAVNKECALALELPPNPEDQRCFECCVPPPMLAEEDHEQEEENNDDVSSVASDSGFKEPEISRCPPMRKEQPMQEEVNGMLVEAPHCSKEVVMRKEQQLQIPLEIQQTMQHQQQQQLQPPPMQDLCFDSAPVAMACAAPPMAAPKPIMRKTMMERPKLAEENVFAEPVVDHETTEEKKKARRGCRGGRRNKRRT